ncbi:Hpt domain-containing protein [Azospirillum sp.]|uniref:Hpt domain-containing protein n=1 Tax=Azospirillum sp. TaxID=34012 RepID=UPI002D6EDF3F|nr:Hpt domain-containing protein [Azospirillum sp.]HYD66899.1 Hpt domain-containing protein [Azospirillum sp.]
MTTPLFDGDLLAELREGLAPEDFRAVFAELPDAVRQQWSELRAALARNDHGAASEAAHSLKGMAASVGATRLAETACAVEQGATHTAAVADLEAAVADTLAAMATFDPPAQRVPDGPRRPVARVSEIGC